jgi:hypothetical protein
MKKITLLFTLLISVFGFSQNLIINGDFANGTNNWAFTGGGGAVVSGEAFYSASNAAGNPWDTQLVQGALSFTGGGQYTLTFKSRAVANRNITVAIQNTGIWSDQFRQNFAITTTMETYTATFTAPLTNGNVQLGFLMGALGSTDGVYFDDITLTLNPCTNGIQDGTETGVDCGGTCAACVTFSAVPTTNAPTPTHLQANVVSVFSDSYTSIATDLNPNWGQSGFGTVNPTFTVTAGNNILAYTNFNYQGTQLTATNLSSMEYLHVDVYSSANPGATVLKVSPISNGAGPAEVLVTINHVQGQWYSVDIPKSAFTGMTWASIHQMKFAANVGASVTPANFYFDNIYFWKTAADPANDATLSDLKVAGVTIPGFAAGTVNYNYEVVIGSTVAPQITSVTTTNSSATTVITQATSIPGNATVLVTSQNGTVTSTYTVSFVASIPNQAPTPSTPNAQVFSIYSDTGGFTNNWVRDYSFGNFASKPDLDQTASVNEAIKMNFAAQGYGEGLDPALPRKDVSAYGYLNFSYYVQSGAANEGIQGHQFYFDLISRIGTVNTESFYGIGTTLTTTGNPDTHIKKVIVFDSWQTVSIPLSDFVGFSPANLFQFKIGSSSDLRTKIAYFDDIYFSVNPGTVLNTNNFTISKVKLYPNPTSNVLNIESLGTIQIISVYNVLGQEVINKALNSTSTSLDISSLNSGIYVVKTVVDGVTSSTKFIKQ